MVRHLAECCVVALATALAKTAAERFVSCEQFAAAFRQAVGSHSTSIQPTQAAIPPGSPLPLKPPTDTGRSSRR